MRMALLLALVGLLPSCGATRSGDAVDGGDGGDGRAPVTGDGAATPNLCADFDAAAMAATAVIGAPCVLLSACRAGSDGTSAGSSVYTETTTRVSGAPVCFADHFQGRVGCPYGQTTTNQAPAGASPCKTPGGEPVVGVVPPQCVNRQASKVVFWSCRCANAEGKTDDGETYCTCPSSTTCTDAISSIGGEGPESELAGYYCLPAAAALGDSGIFSCGTECNPTTAPCP
jgi:hypothetical protein